MIVDCLWESEGAPRLNIHPSAPGSVSLLHAAAVLRDIDVAFCRMNYFDPKCTKKSVKFDLTLSSVAPVCWKYGKRLTKQLMLRFLAALL